MREDTEILTINEKPSLSDFVRKNVDDIRSWAKYNANLIIRNIAYSAGLTTILVIFGYLFSAQFVSNVAATDVDEYMNKSSKSGEYSQSLKEIPKSIIDSSVSFDDIVSSERNNIEKCTGTVIDKIDRKNQPPLYTIIPAKHCVFDENDEYIGDSDLVFTITSKSNEDGVPNKGIPFRIVSYDTVAGKDLIFLAVEPLDNSIIDFTPLGSDKLGDFDPSHDYSLIGVGYPAASAGKPVPVNLSTKNGSTVLGDPSKYIIPVDSFPLSGGGSGSGLFDSDGNMTAVFTNFRYDWWELGQKNIILTPLTNEDIDKYENWISRIMTSPGKLNGN